MTAHRYALTLTRCLYLWTALALAPWPQVRALPPEQGLPPLRLWTPRDLPGGSQNWDVVQDAQGLVFVANNEGVLVYDGVRWQLAPISQRRHVRSLAVDARGRVCVGAAGDFGTLERTGDGGFRYRSLLDAAAPEDRNFNYIWRTLATPRGVYFLATERLFFWDGARVRSWAPPGRAFTGIFEAGGRILVHVVGSGLAVLEGDVFKVLPGTAALAGEKVFMVEPWSAETLLVGTRTGLWLHDGEGIRPFAPEAAGRLAKALLYSHARLPDGTLVIGTLMGGLLTADREGRIATLVDRSTGLPTDSVLGVRQDRTGGLWLGLDEGLARVEHPDPLTRFGVENGLRGHVLSLHRHKGVLYAGTSLGVFRLAPGPYGARFAQVTGIKGQTWHLLSVGEDLLAASYGGVYRIRGGAAEPVATSLTACRWLGRDGDRILVGHLAGLFTLRQGGGTWRREAALQGITEEIRGGCPDGAGGHWLCTGTQGVLRVRVTGAPGAPRAEVVRYGTAQGLPSPYQITVHAFGGGLVFSTPEGTCRFDAARGAFVPDPALGALLAGSPYGLQDLQADPTGRLWMIVKDRTTLRYLLGAAVPAPGGGLRWEIPPSRRFQAQDESPLLVEPGAVWIGDVGLLHRLDTLQVRERAAAPEARLRRAATALGRVLPVDGAGAPVALANREGRLRFEFAAPAFDAGDGVLFQTRMDGLDHDWSPWTREPFKEYLGLWEGSYRFRVRAMDVHGAIGPEAVLAFRVRPPWFRTWWAAATGALLASWGVAALVRRRSRTLRRRNAALEAAIQDRTRELRERTLDLESANAELQALDAQKTNFMGIVAHDLRNPLSGIVLEAQLLQEEDDLAAIRRGAAAILAAGRDMADLIGRFLDVTALESGSLRPEREPVDLRSLAHMVVGRHRPAAEAKGVRLLHASEGGPLWVTGDARFCQGILENLLSNAIKFSPAGRRVTVDLARRGDHVRLMVADEGPGFTEEDRKRLFQRFARHSARPTGQEKSTGLGLSIVKQMVDAMGASIDLETRLGEGARFYVDLPAIDLPNP